MRTDTNLFRRIADELGYACDSITPDMGGSPRQSWREWWAGLDEYGRMPRGTSMQARHNSILAPRGVTVAIVVLVAAGLVLAALIWWLS